MLLKITILPGDGIGPEVIEEAVRVLDAISHSFGHEVSLTRKNIGGAALVASEDPLPPDTLQACISSSAVLLGAVGAPSFDNLPAHLRPEAGLLRLRRKLGAFANLRPAVCYPALEDCSPLRAEVVRGTDILIVRELLGGLYFGEPRLLHGPTGDRAATNTMRYHEPEVQRIARIAFDLARARRHSIVSVDKANVLECSRLWREVVTEIGRDYPDVKLSHMYVDSAAMALVLRPRDFDVLLTENMFGDILSDQAGGVVGSLGDDGGQFAADAGREVDERGEPAGWAGAAVGQLGNRSCGAGQAHHKIPAAVPAGGLLQQPSALPGAGFPSY